MILHGEAGVMIFQDPGSDMKEEHMTRQCCHCGKHWKANPSARVAEQHIRGWCGKCAGYICGPKCEDKCVPIEKMLEIEEGTCNPTAVSVPVKIWTPDQMVPLY